MSEYAEKYAEVTFVRIPKAIEITITDQGNGFDWQRYVNFEKDRVFDSHGRGIAMAGMLSFDNLQYRGIGNQVVCTIAVPEEETLEAAMLMETLVQQ